MSSCVPDIWRPFHLRPDQAVRATSSASQQAGGAAGADPAERWRGAVGGGGVQFRPSGKQPAAPGAGDDARAWTSQPASAAADAAAAAPAAAGGSDRLQAAGVDVVLLSMADAKDEVMADVEGVGEERSGAGGAAPDSTGRDSRGRRNYRSKTLQADET